MNRVRKALKESALTPLQCQMAWILFHVNGEKCALEFIAEVAKQTVKGTQRWQDRTTES